MELMAEAVILIKTSSGEMKGVVRIPIYKWTKGARSIAALCEAEIDMFERLGNFPNGRQTKGLV
jgi:hypothetical protein